MLISNTVTYTKINFPEESPVCVCGGGSGWERWDTSIQKGFFCSKAQHKTQLSFLIYTYVELVIGSPTTHQRIYVYAHTIVCRKFSTCINCSYAKSFTSAPDTTTQPVVVALVYGKTAAPLAIGIPPWANHKVKVQRELAQQFTNEWEASHEFAGYTKFC